MNATIIHHSQPSSSRHARKSRRDAESLESGQKPRKVNSEIRKQQNRIASRNYREKRKRKLQYLQQLLRDQPNDEPAQQPPQPLKPRHGSRTRSLSAEYHVQGHPIQPASFTPRTTFASLASTSGNVIDPVLATSTAYSNHVHPTSQAFSNIDTAWNTQTLYSTPANQHVSSWNVPQWMPNVDFASPMQGAADTFQYTPPHTHRVFEQMPTPPQQPHEPVSNTDLFILGSYGHCRRPVGTPSVSLRSSSPYSQAQYFRAP